MKKLMMLILLALLCMLPSVCHADVIYPERNKEEFSEIRNSKTSGAEGQKDTGRISPVKKILNAITVLTVCALPFLRRENITKNRANQAAEDIILNDNNQTNRTL